MSVVHFLPSRAISERDNTVFIIMGAGGTGSHFAKELGRINLALRSLERREIEVHIIDFDIVSDTTPFRTTFSNKMAGLTKADTLAEDINNFYDTDFNGYSNGDPYDNLKHILNLDSHKTYFVVTCVDTIEARKKVFKIMRKRASKLDKRQKKETALYWLDFGNETDYGQFVLGTMFNVTQPKDINHKTISNMKVVTDIFPGFFDQKDENHDSCSIMDMLQSQNLHINQILATLGAEMIWNFLYYRYISYNGMAINLSTRQFNTFEL